MATSELAHPEAYCATAAAATAFANPQHDRHSRLVGAGLAPAHGRPVRAVDLSDLRRHARSEGPGRLARRQRHLFPRVVRVGRLPGLRAARPDVLQERRLEPHGGFYFPGGKMIGLALLVNLVAAHAVRFKVAAEGKRLVSAWPSSRSACCSRALVIRSGMDQAVESELSPAFLRQILERAACLARRRRLRRRVRADRGLRQPPLARMVAAVGNRPGDRRAGRVAACSIRDFRLDDSGLRILWQLVKGTAAGVVLLVGCVLVFRKRAGIVLLHGGVALMMLSELWIGDDGQRIADDDPRRRRRPTIPATSAPPSWP